MHLALVGISHHDAPIALRERYAVEAHALPDALRGLTHSCPALIETVLLSTCNRMEVYVVAQGTEAARTFAEIAAHLARVHQMPPADLQPFLDCRADQQAVSHLLRVASSLESLVLGEAQILGQVRDALRGAQEAGTVGPTLTALFNQAIGAGKRVQTETGLGRGGFSIGHAAVTQANHIFDNFAGVRVLLVGAGKMGEQTARALTQRGVRNVTVVNRTRERADSLAERLNGRVAAWEKLSDALTEADIVIASTSAPQPIISREMLAPILRRRRGRPLFLMDIALPRDIEPSVGDLDNVFLYNIDDLQAIVSGQAHERRGEIEKADAIIGDETARFLAWYRAREAVPVIADVQAHLARLADERLTILRARLGSVSEREWQMIETQTRALLDQIALPLITRLKREMREQGSSAMSPATYDLLSAARELFGLPQTKATASANDSDTPPTPVRDDDSHFAALSVSDAGENALPLLSVSSFGESKP